MSASAILAIVVVVGEARSPTSAALLGAAQEVLGPAAQVRMVEVPEPTNAAALRVEAELGADSVVVLSWAEPAQLHAVLRFHAARTAGWTVRSMTFAASDTLSERGRTVGLAAASMAPEKADSLSRADPKRPPPTSAPPIPSPALTLPSEAPSPEPAQPPDPPDREPSPAKPRGRHLAVAEVRPEPAAVARPGIVSVPRDATSNGVARRFCVGLAATGAIGVGGTARGAGAEVDGAWFPSRRLGLRALAGARSGSIPALPGTDQVGRAGLGFEWWPWMIAPEHKWGVGLQVSAVVLYHRVTGTDAGGETETQNRLLPGGELFLQAAFAFTRAWELVGGAGFEAAFGATDLRKGAERQVVATIPVARAVARLGLRLRF